MEDDPDAAEDERTIELSSIAAIFPELAIDPENAYIATLKIPVTPLLPLKIAFKTSADAAPPILPTPPTSTEQEDEGRSAPTGQNIRGFGQTGSGLDEHDLSHLPPLTLTVSLPESYPGETPPIVILAVSPPWVPRNILKTLMADCARLWEELGRDQVIYTYIDHLQQAAEDAFGLAGEGGQEVQLSSDMKLSLLDFDLKTKREVFERGTFDCGICLEPKKGIHCHRLMLCSHVFCVACLQDFYNNCIREGDVDNIKCLDPGCGKEPIVTLIDGGERPKKRRKQDRTLNPSELLQIPLEQEIVQRFVRLKRKKRLEADKNTIYCPRQWCQGAARSKKHPKPIDPLKNVDVSGTDSESDEPVAAKSKKPKPENIPMSERLAVCEDCDYAFCSVCKKTWHGELANCNPRRQAELNEEEKASLHYLQLHTTPCPTCDAPAQKTMGCNHMICFKCGTHFCYLCSSYLMPDNPYRHFNDFKSPCYMRLWELEGGDGDDVGNGFAGGRGDNDQEFEDLDLSDVSSDTSDEDFGDFDGDDDFIDFSDGEDTSDDEPAPDQRRPERNMQIELINFAREGAINQQRIIHNIPERRRVAAPPAAPVPPRRGRQHVQRGQQANRQRRLQQEPRRVNPIRHIAVAAPHPAVPPVPQPEAARAAVPAVDEDTDDEPPVPGIRAAAAPGQGNNAAQQPAPVRQLGLERFLQMAARDEEDEWDSDELEDEAEVDVPRAARPGRRGREMRLR